MDPLVAVVVVCRYLLMDEGWGPGVPKVVVMVMVMVKEMVMAPSWYLMKMRRVCLMTMEEECSMAVEWMCCSGSVSVVLMMMDRFHR